MRNASLRTKLTLGFAILMAILFANSLVGYLSVEKLAASNGSFEAAVENETLILVMQAALDQQRSGVRSYLLGGSTLEELEAGKQRFQNAADKLPPLLRTDEGRNLFAHLLQTVNQYGQLRDRSLELRRAGKTKEAVALCLSPEALQAHAIGNRRNGGSRSTPGEQQECSPTRTSLRRNRVAPVTRHPGPSGIGLRTRHYLLRPDPHSKHFRDDRGYPRGRATTTLQLTIFK